MTSGTIKRRRDRQGALYIDGDFHQICCFNGSMKKVSGSSDVWIGVQKGV